MSVYFSLKKKNQGQKISYLQVNVTFKGKVFRRSSGESVPVNKWNDKSQKCIPVGFKAAESINIRLKKIKQACEDVCDAYIARGHIPESEEFWQEVDVVMTGKFVSKSVAFTDYLEVFISRIKTSYAVNTIKKYITTLHKLQDYEKLNGKRLAFDDINLRFYKDFQDYLYSKGLSENSFGSHIKCIKVVFRAARDVDNFHNLNNVEHKAFKVINETADSIYLTEEELLKIHRLNITEELVRRVFEITDKRPHTIQRKIRSLEISRAKFLIGAYTALRVSDFNRLNNVNLKGDFISITTHKTLEPVVIPIHWVIRDILESGFDIQTPISDQKLNKHIKEVAKLAGLTDQVEITTHKGGTVIRETFEKWEKVTTHTCRRSGATNMVKHGIPHLQVMKITGHKSWKSFMKYIKISGEENAILLQQTGYFSKPESAGGV